jgi:hypothetical protein
MKVAYLILAHHQPNHLAKLVTALKGSRAIFFVHIDAKADDLAFRTALGKASDVVFVRSRKRIYWGGYSMVSATLSLLSTARASDDSITRFCLLSGSDFPIKPADQLMNELISEKEFLRVDRSLDVVDGSGFSNRTRFYYFNDVPFNLRKVLSRRVRRDPYSKVPLYHGSQWWSLTRDAVDYIFEFLKANPDYAQFMKHVHCPDETFFHSIIKSSPFAGRITQDFEGARDLGGNSQSKVHGAHYIDWPAEGGRHPKTLGIEDYSELVQSNGLFARKLDEQQSKDLVAKLQSTT